VEVSGEVSAAAPLAADFPAVEAGSVVVEHRVTGNSGIERKGAHEGHE
jgi:hypothetical protein